jgi:hypothetical protein
MSEYLAPDGTAISIEEWQRLFHLRSGDMSPESWWRKETTIGGGVSVSTVWLGLNHEWDPEHPPLFWETMIFGGDYDEDQWRYSSRESALDDHERIVRALREGRDPNA